MSSVQYASIEHAYRHIEINLQLKFAKIAGGIFGQISLDIHSKIPEYQSRQKFRFHGYNRYDGFVVAEKHFQLAGDFIERYVP